MGKLVKIVVWKQSSSSSTNFLLKKNESSAIKIIILDVNYQRWLKEKEKKKDLTVKMIKLYSHFKLSP